MKCGLIGEKLTHSFSAEIHRQLFDYEYRLIEVSADQLDTFMKDRRFSAINVTLPYKEAVIPYLDVVDEAALHIGAVNTIVNRDGNLYGYNTDFDGLYAMVQESGISLSGKRC
jgi:shikimate dehydrogenase